MAYYNNNIENISIADLKTSQVLQGNINRYSGHNTLVSPLQKTVPNYTNVPSESQHVSVSSVLTVRQTAAVARNAAYSNAVMASPMQGNIMKTTATEAQKDQERRIRREIANSNERRRMQSINAGFKSLKAILPHGDDEKLSKAAILQQTSDYIYQLENDKNKLGLMIDKLRKAFSDCKCKHRSVLNELSEKDEGIGSPLSEDYDDMRRNVMELRKQLDKEKRLRMILEEQVRRFQSELYPTALDIKEAGEIILEEVKQVPSFYSHAPSTASLSYDHDKPAQSSKVNVITSPGVLPPVPPLTKTCVTTEQDVPSPTVYIPLNDVKAGNIMRETTVLTSVVHDRGDNVHIPPISNVFNVEKPLPNIAIIQAPPTPVVSKSTQPLKKRPVEALAEDIVIRAKVPKLTVLYPNNNLPSPTCHIPTANVDTITNTPTHNIVSENHQQQHVEVPYVDNNLHKNISLSNYVLPAHGNVVVMSATQWRPRSPTRPQFIQSPSAPPTIMGEYKVVPTQMVSTTVPSFSQTQHMQSSINTHSTPPMVLTQVGNDFVTNNPVFATTEKEITLNELNTVTVGHTGATCPQFVNKIMSSSRHQDPTYLQHSVILPATHGFDTADKSTKIQPVDGTIEQTLQRHIIPNEPVVTRQECVETTLPPVLEQDDVSDDPTEVEIEPSEICVPNGGSSPESSSSIDTHHSRRNLDAIVQAIDHIEQQERRNSQDSFASEAAS